MNDGAQYSKAYEGATPPWVQIPPPPPLTWDDAKRAFGAHCFHGLLVFVVYAVAFGLSAGSVFFNPAAGSRLPALVDDDELVAANSGIWSAAVLSQVLIAPHAGLLATAAGFGWGFALNATSFAVSALLLTSLRSAEAPPPVTSRSMWVRGREGFSLLGRDRLLRALAVAQALAALSAGATSALLVVLAGERLHVSGGGYGLLLSAIAAGAFIGPLLLSRLSVFLRQARVVFAAFGCAAWLISCLPLSPCCLRRSRPWSFTG